MKLKFKNVTKNVIALFCAFVMTFTTVIAATPSGDTATELSEKELYAIELLNVLGIYDGVDSITGKEAFVRRDVMAYLAVRIMGMSDVTYSGEPYFTDIAKNSFAYNAVNILAQMNIIKGTENGKFEPTKDITLDEATEMVLRLMGYTKLIDNRGSKICTELAKEHDLHKGIKYAKDKRLQVKYLSMLLYNTLTCDFPQVVYIDGGNGIEYNIEKGENLLSNTFDVYEIEGVIASNGFTSVDIVSDSGDGQVKIGNEVYQVGQTDADKYVGYYVKAYYREGETNTLICIDVESTNTVVVLDGSDVEYKNFQYITYTKNRKEIYNVSKALNLIYNGKAVYYDKNKMLPQYGTITLINNNKDSAYDTVIINSVKNFIVGSYGTTSNVIQSKYGDSPIDLNKLNENSYSIHKADGKAYKPSSLKEWNVLSIIESEDGEYLDITVSTETISGTVEKISDKEDEILVTIDETEYEIAKPFYNSVNYDLTIGYSGTFYLDMFGRIAAANGTLNQIKWGYIVKARTNDEGFDNLIIKMLTQDSSEVKKFETSDTLFVNDKKYTASNLNTLKLNDYQVVRYSLDKDGKIRRIYTAGDEFKMIAANSSRGFVSNVFVANQVMDIAVDSNTVFMQVPNNAAGDDKTDDEFYSIMSLSNFIRDGWYTVSAYGFEEDEVVAPFVLVERYTSTAATPSGTYMVVSDIGVSVDKNDCAVEKITGYDINKNKVEILTREMGTVARLGIEEGDFFAMVLYPDSSLQRAVQLYDYKTGAFNSNYKARDYNTTNFARFGYAYDIQSNFLLLSDDSASLTSRKVLNTSSVNVLIVEKDAPKDKVKAGSLSDIQTYKRSSEAAKVVFFGSNSVARVIVCYQ